MNASDASAYPTVRQFIAGQWRAGGQGVAAEVRNPATGQVTAELNLAGTDPLELRMFNYLGQEVMRLEDSSPRPGPYFHTFDIGKLRAGLYTVWFRTGETRQSRVLVVGDR